MAKRKKGFGCGIAQTSTTRPRSNNIKHLIHCARCTLLVQMREFSHVADDVECQQWLYDCIDERGKIEKVRDGHDDRETRVGIDFVPRG